MHTAFISITLSVFTDNTPKGPTFGGLRSAPDTPQHSTRNSTSCFIIMEGEDEASLRLHLLCSWQQLHACHDVVGLLRKCGGGRLTEAAQELLLRLCLSSPLAAVFPCAQDYLGRLLKSVAVAAEEDGEEVGEELMDLHTACLLAPQGGGCALPATARLPALPAPPAGWCYKLFAYAPLHQPAAATLECLALLESQLADDGDGPTPGDREGLGGDEQQERSAITAAAAMEQQQQLADGGEVWGSEAAGSAQCGAGSSGGDGGPGCLPALVCPGRGIDSAAGGGSGGLMALRVSRNLFEGGTGCHEWEAGFFLAEVVLSNPALFSGRSCLELGSGCGMVGVALHRAGAAHVTCTDGDTQSVFNCRYNLQLNGVPLTSPMVVPAPCGRLCFRSGSQQAQRQRGGSCGGAACTGGAAGSTAGIAGAAGAVECRELRWEQGARGLAPEVVVGADLLYDPHVVPTLLALVKELLQAGAARQAQHAQQHAALGGQQEGPPPALAAAPFALIATTLRNAATLALFVETAWADAELLLDDVTPVEGGSCLSGGCRGSGAGGGPDVEGAGEAGAEVQGSVVGAGPVRFLHLPALEGARGRVVVHRLTLAEGSIGRQQQRGV